jgi:hypothetical protein
MNITMRPQSEENIFTLNFGLNMDLTLRRVYRTEVKYEGVFHTFTRPDLKPGPNMPVSIFRENKDGSLSKATPQEIKKLRRALAREQQPV